jgi:hypothetical protein
VSHFDLDQLEDWFNVEDEDLEAKMQENKEISHLV